MTCDRRYLKRKINIVSRVNRGKVDISEARSDRESILLSKTARDVSIEGVTPVLNKMSHKDHHAKKRR